jgi:hypothetical protein
VVERGECDGHVAVYCDLQREEIRRVDCEALGRTCLVDVGRGAICDGSTTDTYDEDGRCEDEAAVWRDEDGELQRWTCAEDGLTCQVDACQSGAYCCPGDGAADGGNDVDPCADVICGEDSSHLSMCCSDSSAECDQLGLAGACTSEGAVRYCQDGEIVEYACSGGKTCEVGTCYGGGAECCDESGADECAQLGLYGECDGQVARWCNDGEIIELDCPSQGKTCQLDDCVSGAYCCETPLTCADVGGTTGSCDGDTLRYCNGNDEVVQTDCAAMGKTCAVDDCLTGLAECC